MPKVRSPWWAHLMVYAGAAVMLLAGGGAIAAQVGVNQVNSAFESEDLIEDRLDIGPEIEGPLNFLVLGIDQRVQSDKAGMANAIMILHIDASLENAYLVSVPRDLYVPIGDCGPAWNHGPCENKINHSTSISLNLKEGFANGAKTVTELTGVQFHGGAMVNFEGFLDLIEELGTIELCLEQDIRSIHGERRFYEEGCNRYNKDESLDLVRQRYQYADGDYGRQRMQQQALKQILIEAKNQGYHTNPGKIGTLVDGIGNQIVTDFGDTLLTDLVVALRHIDPGSFRTATVPSSPWNYGGTSYVRTHEGEQATAAEALYAAIRNDTLDQWMATYPDWADGNNDAW
jgi:polyisoprenyl-teichoic acid--peptidoglycan teichoic acid transferase